MINNYKDIFEQAIRRGASDVHIVVDVPLVLRINGSLIRVGEKLTEQDTKAYVDSLLNKTQKEELERMGEIDTSIQLDNIGRFRTNVYKQKGTYCIAARIVESKILTLDQLGLPKAIGNLSKLKKGLVLVTGPTGSGKSTTLAALIDLINSTRDAHILTLEDPIEFIHTHKQGIVTQREMGTDSTDYNKALRAALREDPDVILIGEMRDPETISIAITAAETGHLVLSTLHTIGAAKTIDRIVDVFRPEQQQQIKVQLAAVLQAVVSQQLIKRVDMEGRVAATEIMLSNAAISNLIRESKTHQIDTQIQIGKKQGMQTMDNCLADLYKSRLISLEEAILHSPSPENFQKLFIKNSTGMLNTSGGLMNSDVEQF